MYLNLSTNKNELKLNWFQFKNVCAKSSHTQIFFKTDATIT